MNDASPFFAPRVPPELVESFTTLICNGNEDAAAVVVEQLLAGDLDPEELMLELLAPSARLMGEYWCQDRRDFVEVTLGLARLQQLVRQFRLPLVLPGKLLGNALLVPVPGEQHTFGIRIVEEHLLRAGWKVTALLKATESEITRLVAAEDFDFIGFSASAERLLPVLRSAIHSVRSSSRNKSVRIIVGGVAFTGRHMTASDIDADAIANDAQEAVALANAWCGLVGVE